MVAPNTAPTAGFTFVPTDLTVAFTDNSTDQDAGDTITGWSWDFGDGSTSTSQNPSHTYAAAGTYTVTLIVNDGEADSAPVTQQVTVVAPPDTVTVLSASYNSNKGELRVMATSSMQPQVVLTLAGFGEMPFKRDKYDLKVRNVSPSEVPPIAEVISSGGGRASLPIEGVPQPVPPGRATEPVPNDTATGVGLSPTLTWTAGSNSSQSDIYFGVSGSLVFAGTTSSSSYSVGPLTENTVYQWRIDERNDHGTTPGDVWTFTTRGEQSQDLVTITKAEWRSSRNLLKIEATSDLSPDAVLSVDGLGAMSYQANKNKYVFESRSLSENPGNVTVSSSLGGAATSAVQQR